MKISLFLLLTTVTLLSSCQSPPQASHPEPGTFQRSGEIQLEVSTSKKSYRVGETFHFTVRPSEDCYLRAWVLGADGVTTPLYPNAHAQSRLFRRGVTARLPGDGPYALRVSPPAGREQLIVVASSAPLAADEPPPGGQWLKSVTPEPAPAASSGSATKRRGEARLVYEVLP